MISRRQFLQMGSVAALSAPVALRATPLGTDSIESAGATPSLSVGFWSGRVARATGPVLTHRRRGERRARLSHEVLAQGAPFRSDVRAAKALAAGDPGLRGSARLTVHGLMTARSPWVRSRLESLALDIHFDAAHLARSIPCRAWHYHRSPSPGASAGVTMNVPVSDASDLRLALEGRRGARGRLGRSLAAIFGLDNRADAARHEALFTTGTRGGAAKLRSGVYFFAWLAPGAPEPRWSDFQFRPIPALDGARVLVRRGFLGLEAPDFDYVTASVSPQAAGVVSLAS